MKRFLKEFVNACKETSVLKWFILIGITEVAIYSLMIATGSTSAIWYLMFWALCTFICIFFRLKFNIVIIELLKYKIRKAEKKSDEHKVKGNTVVCSAYANLIKSYKNTIIYLKVEQ